MFARVNHLFPSIRATCFVSTAVSSQVLGTKVCLANFNWKSNREYKENIVNPPQILEYVEKYSSPPPSEAISQVEEDTRVSIQERV